MNKKGFTMLELLWVLVIIGFLTAMIAPRLGGVSEKAKAKVNEANLKDIKKCVETFQQDFSGDFPDRLINLMLADDNGIVDAAGECIKPAVEDLTNDVMESISDDFDIRCLLTEHTLSADEANELRAMGINEVLSWNHPDDPDYDPATHANRFDRVDVAAGVVVLMIGGGAADETADITPDSRFDALGEDIGNPEWLYRIVLGIGPDCEMVTEYYIEAAPLCPAGINNSRYFYNYYSIVLPRLSATLDRFGSLPFDDDDLDGYLDFDVIDRDDTTSGQVKRVQLKDMTASRFDIVNATGHGRQEDVKFWRLYDDGDGL